MPGDKHSRTEKPTARRKKEARKQGNVARTPEVVTWLVVLVGSYLVPDAISATYVLMEKLWARLPDIMATPNVNGDMAFTSQALLGGLYALAPVLLAITGVAIVVNLAQTRGLITFHPLKPSFGRLSPKAGLQRILSPRSLWEVSKQLIRVALLSLVVWQTVHALLPVLAGSGPASTETVASAVGGRALGLTREVAEIGLVLAALDYIVQFRKVSSQLKMSREELKEEHKSSEGNPFTKGAVRRRQRQVSRNRMMAAVSAADAVVVNPTHFAVAVSYVRGRGAPRVVAKGADLLAMRIREEAEAKGVPVVEDPPLARALYAACELEHEVPTELYEAVARLLTFIYGLRASGRTVRIDGAPHRPSSSLIPASTAERIVAERGLLVGPATGR